MTVASPSWLMSSIVAAARLYLAHRVAHQVLRDVDEYLLDGLHEHAVTEAHRPVDAAPDRRDDLRRAAVDAVLVQLGVHQADLAAP